MGQNKSTNFLTPLASGRTLTRTSDPLVFQTNVTPASQPENGARGNSPIRSGAGLTHQRRTFWDMTCAAVEGAFVVLGVAYFAAVIVTVTIVGVIGFMVAAPVLAVMSWVPSRYDWRRIGL